MARGNMDSNAAEQKETCLWQEFNVTYRFPVYFTRGVFALDNPLLARILTRAADPPRVLALADDGLMAADPTLGEKIQLYAQAHQQQVHLAAPLQVLPGGERCKQDPSQVRRLHRIFLDYRLCRHSLVMAIGGGAFLDVVGYAAATAHRGIGLIRLPTTTLSQNDAGVGVKNGCNAFGRKNWVGSFCPPAAVVNDFDFLQTLSPRLSRVGIAEAVKVALIKDAAFYTFLSEERRELAALHPGQMASMIIRCAELHMRHVAQGGDPFESGSARPLDFGHWSAHALEEISNGGILHGEAVAIGMALDARYAYEKGLFPLQDLEHLIRLLQDLGFHLSPPELVQLRLPEALDRFRQHLGGRLTIRVPTGIGQGIDVHELDLALVHRSREWLLSLPTGEAHGQQSSPHGQATARPGLHPLPLAAA